MPKQDHYSHPWFGYDGGPEPIKQRKARLLGWFESGNAWCIQRPAGDYILCGENNGTLEIVQTWPANRDYYTFNNYIRRTSGDYKPLQKPIMIEAITLQILLEEQEKIDVNLRTNKDNTIKNLEDLTDI